MGRALTIQRTLVTPGEREKFQDKLRRKHEYYSRVKVRFWAFEEASLPGAFLEFFEADDAPTLARAHAGAPEPVLDPNRVYTEVELR
jgi:hypothetical protein